MRQRTGIAVGAVVLVGLGLTARILTADRAPQAGGEERAAGARHGEEAVERGPHGGRLLTDRGFAAEVTIFERGTPPHFRLYFYDRGEPVDPTTVDATVTLRRLGGRVETFRFVPQGEFLAGDPAVAEPHSFEVAVEATRKGEPPHRWTYGSYEARVELTAEAAAGSGIEVATAGPAKLETRLRLNGLIAPNEDRLAHVLPRFAGIVKEARKRVGDRVEKGEVVAVVQSNQSLEPYDVRSEIAGTVIQKHVTPGEFVSEGDDLFTVADLGTVWVDLNVYRQDFARLAVGQPVLLDPGEGIAKAEARLAYISPFGAPNTQTMLARVVLPNPNGDWRPGLFVTAEVLVDQATVPLAVRASAIQTLRDWSVVFVQEGDVYEAQPVEVGRRDGEWVEVLSGLKPGQRYAARGSFVLKADVGKAGASHDH